MARDSGDRPGRKQTRRPVRHAAPAMSDRDRIATLEQERASLAAALAAANARIAELETGQTEAADRIAWALDTLHSLLDENE
jgi:hypothetical protein